MSDLIGDDPARTFSNDDVRPLRLSGTNLSQIVRSDLLNTQLGRLFPFGTGQQVRGYGRQQDVTRLQVAVDDPLAVRVGHGAGEDFDEAGSF